MTRLIIVSALFLMVMGCTAPKSNSPDVSTSTASVAFDKLVDDYFDAQFKFQPEAATAAGFHQYDANLRDYSRTAVDAEVASLKSLQSRLDEIDAAKLSQLRADDLAVMQNGVRGELLQLETIQMWRKDPNEYSSGVTGSIFLIIKRSFAPPQDRLRSVIARERQIPAALAAARQNLENPPQIYTQIALQQSPGIIEFFRKDVPEAFKEVKDEKLLAEFRASNTATIKALQEYETYLHENLLPRSKGDFRIGPENFRKKLLYEEMVEIPLNELIKIGYADLHRNQALLKETAARIDPQKNPYEILAGLGKSHPQPNQLLQSFRDNLGDLRKFIEEKHVITIPSQTPPIIEETPPFMRATTMASMDTPGPFETVATEAMFNITLPEPGWKPERVAEWMEGYNRGAIVSTSVHEVYPGHYTQFLWAKQFPSKVRKLTYCGTNVEGWAHYTEQMMLDEGYGGGDPKLRVGQLQDALLRDARFIVGIEMHTGQMTLAQAKEFFVKEGYQSPPVAELEAKRGSSDPTYLVYTLGKLQFLKLREDYRKKLGGKFTLQEFHDRFMKIGGVPFKIVRREMLGDDSPAL